MSAILEALKKVEREAAADLGPSTPWPAPPTETRNLDRPSLLRRWILPGIVGLGIAGLVLAWQLSPLDAPGPESSMQTNTPAVPVDDGRSAQSVKRPAAPPAPPATAPLPSAATSSMATASSPQPHKAIAPVRTPSVPPARAPAARHAPPKTEPAAPVPAPSSPSQNRAAAAAPRARADTPPTEAGANDDPSPSAGDAGKTFRHDPRIQLQALVWSPEAGERFVVINDRLIKEGGALDDIVVVRINRDDVLLSEGGDRWHERFQLR